MRGLFRATIRNWQLKLLAIVLAVLLWVVVTAEQITTAWVTLPFQVQDSDPAFDVVPESVPGSVRVRFAGPGRAFIQLAVRRPPVLLRVGEVEDEEHVFELTASMVRLPDGMDVDVYDIDPAFVRLGFRALEARDLPVRVFPTGTVSEEWALVGPLTVVPALVRVSGPADQLARLETVSTLPIDLPREEGRFERIVPIDSAGLLGLDLSTAAVRVSGRMERQIQRRIPGVAVRTGTSAIVRPATVDLLVRGAQSVLDSLGLESLTVELAIDSIPRVIPDAGVMVPVRVPNLPAGVSVGISPSTVQLYSASARADSADSPESGSGAIAPAADVGQR